MPQRLDETGLKRAANEMREALRDISRRPEPDITGAIQHAMAALEATAREATGQSNPTLGNWCPFSISPRLSTKPFTSSGVTLRIVAATSAKNSWSATPRPS